MQSKELSESWVLIRSGNKRFALNSAFIVGIEDFKNSDCIKASLNDGAKRGEYKILGMDLHILDCRKLLGETPIINMKMEFSESMHKRKYELSKWLEDLENSIIYNRYVELDYTKLNFYEWINQEEKIQSIHSLKMKIALSYREMFINAKEAVDAGKDIDKGINEALKLHKLIKDTIYVNIEKCINKIIIEYGKTFEEHCLIISHKGKRYGLLVDDVEAITDNIRVTPKYSEYKIIAGECYYNNQLYNVINLKYTSSLVSKFEDK